MYVKRGLFDCLCFVDGHHCIVLTYQNNLLAGTHISFEPPSTTYIHAHKTLASPAQERTCDFLWQECVPPPAGEPTAGSCCTGLECQEKEFFGDTYYECAVRVNVIETVVFFNRLLWAPMNKMGVIPHHHPMSHNTISNPFSKTAPVRRRWAVMHLRS